MFDLPEGFDPYLGPTCVVCKTAVPAQKVGFEKGAASVCVYCVAEIRGRPGPARRRPARRGPGSALAPSGVTLKGTAR